MIDSASVLHPLREPREAVQSLAHSWPNLSLVCLGLSRSPVHPMGPGWGDKGAGPLHHKDEASKKTIHSGLIFVTFSELPGEWDLPSGDSSLHNLIVS